MTRSCVICHSRKVKCDRSLPCSNCALAGVGCVYPHTQTTRRKRRKPAQSREVKLLERLQKLELLLEEQELEAHHSEEFQSPTSHSSQSQEAEGTDTARLGVHRPELFRSQDGTSRYINSSPWALIRNELNKVRRDLSDYSISDDDDTETRFEAERDSETRWFFGTPGLEMPVPTVEKATTLWNIFKERVDPVVKVVHIPTLEPQVLSAMMDPSGISPAFECLLVAIYYGALTSITPIECQTLLQEDHNDQLQLYRSSFGSAISRADFLVTQDIVVIQALVLYLFCRRKNNDDRVVWTIIGLIVRLSQGLGLHRDGTYLGLPPFETEMRRRLWWQICMQDTRASEDYGCDTAISEQMFDTRLPLNINDSEIDPAMEVLPLERIGFSEMSFCTLRYEAGSQLRLLKHRPLRDLQDNANHMSSWILDEKRNWMTDFRRHFERKYQQGIDESEPLAWVTIRAARMIMTKASLILFSPFQDSLPNELREMLFVACVEHLEVVHSFNTDPRAVRWRWTFETNMPWYVLSYTLNELCRRDPSQLTDRAWAATSRVLGTRNFESNAGLGRLWEPLMTMLSRSQHRHQWHPFDLDEMEEDQTEGQSHDTDEPRAATGLNEGVTPDHSKRQELESFLAEAGVEHSDVHSWKNLLRQIYTDNSSNIKSSTSQASSWRFHSSIIGGTMVEF